MAGPSGTLRVSGPVALFSVALAAGLTLPSESQDVPSDPGPRIGHALAYDEVRGGTVLFGGFGPDGIPKGDTWEWNGEAWHRIEVDGPSPRKWPAMAFDAGRRSVILFGGREGVGRTGRSCADTWEWDGKTWRRLSSDGPSGRDHHGMVYDRARGTIVLFGGWDGQAVVGDTWEWSGTWKQASVAGPPARAAHAMAYDEEGKTTVLFGGRALEIFYDDTWLWNGKAWSRAEGKGPSKRAFHGMTYVADSQSTILFGGRLEAELYGDTWAWDGERWTKLTDTGPSNRYVYAMAFDHSLKRGLFFGGGHRAKVAWVLYDETWLWNGSHWQMWRAQ